MKKSIISFLIIFLILGIGLSVYANEEKTNAKAKVIETQEIKEVKQENSEDIQKIQEVKVRILEGEYKNEEYDLEYTLAESADDIYTKSELQKNSKIIVALEEKDGEVTSVSFKENISYGYIICTVILGLLIILLMLQKKSIKPLIISAIIVLSIGGIFMINAYKDFDLLITTIIVSLIDIILISLIINGLNKKMFVTIVFTIIETIITAMIMYILVNVMQISGNILCSGLIKAHVDINNLLIAIGILTSSIIGVILSGIIMNITEDASKLLYKTKSNNIIEGQRSLKL